MSVLEIIEQIKALPPDEREAVFALVEKIRTPVHAGPGRPASDEEFEKAANHVFKNYLGVLERLAKSAVEPRGTLGDFLSLWKRDPDDAKFADDLERANSRELPNPNPWDLPAHTPSSSSLRGEVM